MYRPRPPPETPDAEGYAELIDDGRRVEIYGKALEVGFPAALSALSLPTPAPVCVHEGYG